MLTLNIIRTSPGVGLGGDSPFVHHGAELSVAQLVVLSGAKYQQFIFISI